MSLKVVSTSEKIEDSTVLTQSGSVSRQNATRFEQDPWHQFSLSHTVVSGEAARGIVKNVFDSRGESQGTAEWSRMREEIATPIGEAHHFSLPLFSVSKMTCSPLRPGKGHPIKDTDAMVMVDSVENIHIFTAPSSDGGRGSWERVISESSKDASSSKEIVANICFASAASLFDVYSQVLKPLLGPRPVDAPLDDPCGILDALDSRSLVLPEKPHEVDFMCEYLRQMDSAANYLERSASQLLKTIEVLVSDGWVSPKASSKSLTLLNRVIVGLQSIQTKTSGACSRLEGQQSEQRERGSAYRDNLSNGLAVAGLAVAALPVLGSLLPGQLPAWVTTFSPLIGGTGIAALAGAYFFFARGREEGRGSRKGG